jgi:hypothetical protein
VGRSHRHFAALRRYRLEVSILRRQVKQGQDALAEAARATMTAERAVTEATRARIDARASHVVAFISKSHWPPYLDRGRGADAWGHPSPLDPLNHERMKPEMRFGFPKDAEMSCGSTTKSH